MTTLTLNLDGEDIFTTNSRHQAVDRFLGMTAVRKPGNVLALCERPGSLWEIVLTHSDDGVFIGSIPGTDVSYRVLIEEMSVAPPSHPSTQAR